MRSHSRSNAPVRSSSRIARSTRSVFGRCALEPDVGADRCVLRRLAEDTLDGAARHHHPRIAATLPRSVSKGTRLSALPLTSGFGGRMSKAASTDSSRFAIREYARSTNLRLPAVISPSETRCRVAATSPVCPGARARNRARDQLRGDALGAAEAGGCDGNTGTEHRGPDTGQRRLFRCHLAVHARKAPAAVLTECRGPPAVATIAPYTRGALAGAVVAECIDHVRHRARGADDRQPEARCAHGGAGQMSSGACANERCSARPAPIATRSEAAVASRMARPSSGPRARRLTSRRVAAWMLSCVRGGERVGRRCRKPGHERLIRGAARHQRPLEPERRVRGDEQEGGLFGARTEPGRFVHTRHHSTHLGTWPGPAGIVGRRREWASETTETGLSRVGRHATFRLEPEVGGPAADRQRSADPPAWRSPHVRRALRAANAAIGFGREPTGVRVDPSRPPGRRYGVHCVRCDPVARMSPSREIRTPGRTSRCGSGRGRPGAPVARARTPRTLPAYRRPISASWLWSSDWRVRLPFSDPAVVAAPLCWATPPL